MPLAGYSGTPLVKKLGIKPDSRLVILRAPDGFRDELKGLPDGVAIGTRLSGVPELTIWFVTRRKELEGDIARISVAMGQGLWIAWPKKSSALAVDVTEDVVRNAGLAHGLVDYKVCAIDETWSGLKFARRKKA